VGGVVELGGGWQIVKRGEGSYMARRAGELTFAE
jgi:hypothetical protein